MCEVSDLHQLVGKVVICPKCGEVGILAIVKERRRCKGKVYHYEYLVVRHADTNHVLGRVNSDKILDIVKKLKIVKIQT